MINEQLNDAFVKKASDEGGLETRCHYSQILKVNKAKFHSNMDWMGKRAVCSPLSHAHCVSLSVDARGKDDQQCYHLSHLQL